jgi:uncharacterized membrane protein YkoI
MNALFKSVLIGGLAGAGLLLAAAAGATDQDRVRELSRSGAIVPLERITSQVRARDIAHILEVELESEDGRYYYEVEALDDAGVVHELKYDAGTGELIEERQKQ